MGRSRVDISTPRDIAVHDAPVQEVVLPLVLHLSELAASADAPSALLHSAATALQQACHAATVALFRVVAPASAHVGHCHRLTEVAAAPKTDTVIDQHARQRLCAAGIIALRQPGQPVRSPARTRPGHTDPAPAVCAVAFGTPSAHTVLVVCSQDLEEKRTLAVLGLAMPAIGALMQLAHLRLDSERTARRHDQLQAIFSHSSEAIVTVDQSFHIVEANPAFATLLEWEADSALGQHCSAVLKCRDERGQLLCGTESCPLSQTFVYTNAAPYREVRWQTATGGAKEVSASFAVVPSPEGPRGVIIARDISPVNAANRMRANFTSMVSHELRTPLNSINGFLEIVLEGHVGALNARQEEFLNYARTSTHQLMTLVEDILFISRADTGQFQLRFDTVAIPDVVAQVMKNFRSAAQRAQVHLDVDLHDDLPTVYADELRLQQVLSNLINNAIKFTPPDGTVTVRAHQLGDIVQFDVSDTGEGIQIEEQERIFERFYQSASRPRGNAGGYGLGLAIAKLIVEQHDGRIWAQTRPSGGSTFTFTIPLHPRASAPMK